MRKTNACIKVQAKLQGYLARKKALALRTYKCKIVRIQKWYRKLYRRKLKATKLLQKVLRTYKVTHKVAK